MNNLETLKNWYGKTKALVIFLVFILLGAHLTLDFSKKNNSVQQNASIEINNGEIKSSKNECEEKYFWENLHEWEMPGLKVDIANKEVCGKSRKTYYSDATLVERIPAAFTNYSYSYVVKYKNGKIATHLVRLGEEFIDLFIHEENPQILGVSTLKVNYHGPKAVAFVFLCHTF